MKFTRQSSCFFGQLEATSGVFSGKLVAELRFLEDDLETLRQPIDTRGRFLFELDDETINRLTGHPVEIAICSQSGEVLASKSKTIPKGDAVENIKLLIPSDKQEQIEELSIILGHDHMLSPFAHRGIPGRHLTELTRVLQKTGNADSVRVPAWVNLFINDLDQASWNGHLILDGEETHLLNFANLLEHSPELPDRSHPFRSQFGVGFGQRHIVPPSTSFNIGLIGLILDEYDHDPESNWTDRTLNFLNERVRQLNQLYETAFLVDKGDLPLQTLTTLFHDHHHLQEPLMMPITLFEDEPLAPPGRGFEFPTEAVGESYWADCIRDIQRTGLDFMQSRPKTTDVGSIVPDLACGGQEIEVEIRPKQGINFGTGPSGSTLRYAEKQGRSWEVSHDTWSPDRIKVTLPTDAHSGHFYFERSFTSQGLTEGCSELLLHDLDVRLRDALAFLDRYPRLGPSEELNNKIELVQSPVVESFTANGSETNHIAEACRFVTVAWRVSFGNPATAAADDLSLDRIQVSILEGSTVVANDLKHEGILLFKDEETRYLTLKAESRVGDAVCGEDSKTLTIRRVQMLHVEFPDNELQAGTSMEATVFRSCSSITGSVISLTTDSELISVPDSVTISSGKTTASFSIEAAQSGCAKVTLLAESPFHQSDKGALFIYEPPTVSSFTPRRVTACRKFDLRITGTCFAVGETRVSLSKGSEVRNCEVLSISENLMICRVEDLTPGEWSVMVKSRGLRSPELSLKLTADFPQPRIKQFKVRTPFHGTFIEPCVDNLVIIEWDVEFGSHLIITDEFTGDVLADRVLADPCGHDTGRIRHTINSGRTIKLDVFSNDPNNAADDSTVTISETVFGVGNYSQILIPIDDLSDDGPYALWYLKLNVPGAEPRLVGTVVAGGEIEYTLDDCDKYEFRLLSQKYADDANNSINLNEELMTIDDPDDTRAFHNGAVWKMSDLFVLGRSDRPTYIPNAKIL